MLVSVIIPCFNVEKDITACIYSVINQTHKDVEIILVDNNSTDSTKKLLQEFKAKYSSNITVFQEKKQGAPAARNKGLRHANGIWIQFLDADDILLENKIQDQLSIIKTSGVPLDFIAGSFKFVYLDGREKDFVTDTIDPWNGLLWSSLGNTCSNLWRKRSLEVINGWDEDLESSQEYDLMFRLLLNDAKVGKDTNFSTIVRQRANSISTAKDQASNYGRILEVSTKVFDYFLNSKERLKCNDVEKFKLGYMKHLVNYGRYNINKANRVHQKYFSQKPEVQGEAFSRIFSYLYNHTNFYFAQLMYNYYRRLKKALGLDSYKIPFP